MAVLRRRKQRSRKPSGAAREENARVAAARKQLRLLTVSVVLALAAFASIVLSWSFFAQEGEPEYETAGASTATASLERNMSADGEAQMSSAERPAKTIRQHAESSAESAQASNDAYDFRIAVRAGSVDRSLFEEGKPMRGADPVVQKLSEIFGWDIDFALDMHEGDTYLVMYEDRYAHGRKAATTILAAEFVNRGRVYRAIGFPAADGKIAYFTPTGKRLQRMFLRSPVDVSNVSSQFSKSRYHPILNIWRAHTGVDYAAAPGAPVHATASGRVIAVGWNGGYGRTVVLQHAGQFSTLYGHLSRYREGLEVGAPVAQGEVIGYVGQSGLATGPHLHYEFRVNGEHRDPLAFRPRESNDESISPKLREEFFHVVRTRMERLDLYGGRQLASQ